MKNWQIMGVLTVLIIGTVLMSGCTNTGSTSAAPVATPTPQIVSVTVTASPTPQANPQLESDKLFFSEVDKYNIELARITNQEYLITKSVEASTLSQSLENLGYWANKLKSTCSDAKIKIRAISVSQELQPAKDEYLGVLSDFEKSADSNIAAINYYNNGKESLAVSSLQAAQAYTDSGNAKVSITAQRILIYRDKLGI